MSVLNVRQTLILCLLLGSRSAVADSSGSISGVVLNNDGISVFGAKVAAVPSGLAFHAVRYVETDSAGHFLIDHLPWGDYSIHTRKDSERYADSGQMFYNGKMPPRVTLSASTPSVTLTLRLGLKAAVIQGTVTNAATGRPVTTASVTITYLSAPYASLGKTLHPEFSILIPSNVKLSMEVQAEGYVPWRYPGYNKTDDALLEQADETRDIQIRLIPR